MCIISTLIHKKTINIIWSRHFWLLTGAPEMLIFIVHPSDQAYLVWSSLSFHLFGSDSIHEQSDIIKQAYSEHLDHSGSNWCAIGYREYSEHLETLESNRLRPNNIPPLLHIIWIFRRIFVSLHRICDVLPGQQFPTILRNY